MSIETSSPHRDHGRSECHQDSNEKGPSMGKIL